MLDAEEPLFTQALRQLEDISNNKSVDVRLIAEINDKVRTKIRKLGLDPDDTTGPELYAALMARVRRDNERITEMIGAQDHSHIQSVVEKSVETVLASNIPKKCWALKRSVAKNMLKKMPPKQMMKHLGYRSIDSMFKNENFDEIYSALRFSEGGEWLNEYNELFKKVKPSDFESRDISFVIMDHDKWADMAEHFVQKKLHNVTHTKELGTIIVVPMKFESMQGLTLKTLPLLFHYVNEIRLYSSYFKLSQVKPDFGEEIVDTLIADPGNHAVMAGQNIHWRVIQRYFGKLKDESHPEAFQPHLHPEDLHWRKAEEALYELDPEMEFWEDMDYVARMEPDGKPSSFNLTDISFAFSNQIPYSDRYVYHFRESLWNEIFARYMGQKVLEEQVLVQLDNDMIAPEKLVQKPKKQKKKKTKKKKTDDKKED